MIDYYHLFFKGKKKIKYTCKNDPNHEHVLHLGGRAFCVNCIWKLLEKYEVLIEDEKP